MYVCVYMEYEGQYCEAGEEKEEWELVSPVVHSNWQDKGCYYCEIVGALSCIGIYPILNKYLRCDTHRAQLHFESDF